MSSTEAMHTEVFLASVGVFVAVAACCGAAIYLWAERVSPERRRLTELAGQGLGQATVVRPESTVLDTAKVPETRLGRFVPKSPKAMGRLRRRLAAAGYHRPAAAVVYALCELGLPVLLAVAPLLLLPYKVGLIAALFGALVGFFLPGLIVDHKVRVRQKEVRNGLPDALDVLIVCIEAGNAIDQAIMKAAEELQVSHPVLAEELRLVNIETRAGKPRLEAFKNFAERTKVDDVRSLVAMLVQTDRFGTSIAQAMKTYADVLRTKRRQRAEERAAKLGVKLVIPLVFFLFPALYVVTLGPAIVQYVRVFRVHVNK
jgi:tight adherence protein C